MEYLQSAVGAAKLRRASRFIEEDGRSLLVALDMQTATGAGPDLDAVEKVALGGPNGILASWQIARRYPEAFRRCGLVLRIDGGPTMLGTDPGGDRFARLYGVESAARIGADAVVCMVFPGAPDEDAGLRRLASIVDAAEQLGLPVVAESIPGSWAQAVPWDAEHIARAARICVEIGADAVKTMMPGDPSEIPDVIADIEAPVFCLGGPRKETEDEAVEYARMVVAAGASGVAFGRNVFGAGDPTAMVGRLYDAVHGA